MAEAKEDSFNVVDKRRFNESGDLKADAPKDADVRSEPAKASPPAEKKPAAASDPAGPVEITFSLFMQSLAHQVFVGLGLAPNPESNLMAKNLDQARQTIDIMTMLRKKAEGNLEIEEAKMLDGLLYELRMTFVRVKEGSFNMPSDTADKKVEGDSRIVMPS